MRFPWRILLVISALVFSPVGLWAALPEEITVTAPTKLEIMRGDRVSGSLALKAGERLSLVDVTGDYALVRYRNLNGRVPVAQTNLPRADANSAPAVEAAVAVAKAPSPSTVPVPKTTVAPPAHVPANAIERALDGKLVRLDGGALRPVDGARLAGVKFYGIYFSAGWCGPCREFTPGFVDAYGKIREIYPEFEVVLVNLDQSAADMLAYMRDDHMPWPALRWDTRKSTHDITRYGGSGIPCLVLVDETGKVLSDSYRWGRYVGPDAVLEDTWKILRDYRRKTPRAKT